MLRVLRFAMLLVILMGALCLVGLGGTPPKTAPVRVCVPTFILERIPFGGPTTRETRMERVPPGTARTDNAQVASEVSNQKLRDGRALEGVPIAADKPDTIAAQAQQQGCSYVLAVRGRFEKRANAADASGQGEADDIEVIKFQLSTAGEPKPFYDSRYELNLGSRWQLQHNAVLQQIAKDVAKNIGKREQKQP